MRGACLCRPAHHGYVCPKPLGHDCLGPFLPRGAPVLNSTVPAVTIQWCFFRSSCSWPVLDVTLHTPQYTHMNITAPTHGCTLYTSIRQDGRVCSQVRADVPNLSTVPPWEFKSSKRKVKQMACQLRGLACLARNACRKELAVSMNLVLSENCCHVYEACAHALQSMHWPCRTGNRFHA